MSNRLLDLNFDKAVIDKILIFYEIAQNLTYKNSNFKS